MSAETTPQATQRLLVLEAVVLLIDRRLAAATSQTAQVVIARDLVSELLAAGVARKSYGPGGGQGLSILKTWTPDQADPLKLLRAWQAEARAVYGPSRASARSGTDRRQAR